MASVSQSSQPHTTEEISPCLSVLQLPEPAEFAGVGGLIGGLCVHPIIGKVPGSHLLVSRLEEASCRHAQGTEAVASSLSLSLDIKAFLCLVSILLCSPSSHLWIKTQRIVNQERKCRDHPSWKRDQG